MWIVCGCGQLYLDCKIAYLWHNWYYYLHPLCAKHLCQNWLCGLCTDSVKCILIVILCLNCTIAVFGTGDVGLSLLYLDCVDCIWIARLYLDYTIAWFGCTWIVLIVRLYLDCMFVFGLYNCGIWHRGRNISYTLPPPLVSKSCAKKNCVDCS